MAHIMSTPPPQPEYNSGMVILINLTQVSLTPCFSIWPAGIPGNAQGTIDWAGGLINWSDPDYVSQGQFATLVKSVSIKCTPETSATSANGTIPKDAQSYVYMSNDTTGLTPRVYVSSLTTNVNSALSRFGLEGQSTAFAISFSIACSVGLVTLGLTL